MSDRRDLSAADQARLMALVEGRRRALETVGEAEAHFDAKRRSLIAELDSFERTHVGQRARLIERAEKASEALLAFATSVRGEYCDSEGDWELDVAAGAFVRAESSKE